MSSNVEKELEFIRAELSKLLARSGVKPVAMKVPVAAWAVGLGETKFKSLLRSKEIDSFTVGKCRLVRVAELERWAEAQSKHVEVRYPKTKKSVGQKIRAALKKL